MKYRFQYQYKDLDAARPDGAQIEKLEYEAGELILLPSVGDSVSLRPTAAGPRSYRVLTRHFSYVGGEWCFINIVVTDLPPEQYAARLKE